MKTISKLVVHELRKVSLVSNYVEKPFRLAHLCNVNLHDFRPIDNLKGPRQEIKDKSYTSAWEVIPHHCNECDYQVDDLC